jgi:hypothetical protein
MAATSNHKSVIDDSDISGPVAIRTMALPSVFTADEITMVKELKTNKIIVSLLYQRKDELLPLRGLQFLYGNKVAETNADGLMELECQGKTTLKASLANAKFQIQDTRSRVYELALNLECGFEQRVIFYEKSAAGEAMSIYETLSRAEVRLHNALQKDIWGRQLKVVWPSNGDYYNFNQLHITVGYQWDVVGHELGHAIYDLGKLGAWGGGQHKIDECYSEGMALSEGWATFFAGWLYIDLADNDAKFEYLVPRRAPIQIEHVPQDVCNAPTNEWRVASFLWDLIDLNDDGESVDAIFAITWNALENSKVSGPVRARALFERTGISKENVERAWNNNFR